MKRYIDINEFDGTQKIDKADRIILHSVLDDIIVTSNNNILLSANNEIHVNGKEGIFLNVYGKNRIILGKAGTDDRKKLQPIVLGISIAELLDDMLQLLATFKMDSPMGTSITSDDTYKKIDEYRNKYLSKSSNSYILSDLVFIADNISK